MRFHREYGSGGEEAVKWAGRGQRSRLRRQKWGVSLAPPREPSEHAGREENPALERQQGIRSQFSQPSDQTGLVQSAHLVA